jgi:hypothetical protein
MKHESKDGTLYISREGVHLKNNKILYTPSEGSTFSKWVVENQKHHIHQIKKVTGQPKKALDII